MNERSKMDRVRDEIAQIVCFFCRKSLTGDYGDTCSIAGQDRPLTECKALMKEVDGILDIDGLEVLDKNQEWPRFLVDPEYSQAHNIRTYKEILRREGWRKVVR